MVIKGDHSIKEPKCRGRNHEHVRRGDVRMKGEVA